MAVNKIFIPTLISSVTYEPVRTLPHIYFYNGLKDSEPYFIQHYSGSSTSSVEVSEQNSFPYVDYYDGLTSTTGSNSLLFFNETAVYGETPTASLYTEYWDTYVSLLYNPRTRLFKASAIIPLADYFEMELNDIVQWRGNYYHLRAINDYNLKDGTCKIELLGPIIRDAVGGVEPPTPTPGLECNFDFSSSIETIDVEYLIVAGGGGGGSRHAGGGGAGGYLTGSLNIPVGSINYSVLVGAGGSGTTGLGVGTNGNNSSVFSIAAHGGGGGGGEGTSNGAIGGSGGGALGVDGAIGGVSSGSQGFAGGNGVSFAGGGGGGASQLGFNGTRLPNTQNIPGNGGSGSAWVDGVFRAGGGGGAGQGFSTIASGGIGGGGQGGDGNSPSLKDGISGSINTGGGGGAGAGFFNQAGNGGSGGSGIVIIRYAGTPQGTGGTITQSGGFTFHTFTSSGTFTAGGFVTTTTTTTTTTLAPTTTTTTTLAPTTTTTTIAYDTFVGSGYGNTVNEACSDASINNRTLYSDCSSISVGCTIYTTTAGTLLTGFTFVFIDGAVWDINSSTGVITNYSSIQC
jgi:hypothetical protein